MKIFAKDVCDKELLPKVYKELLHSTIRKQANQLNTGPMTCPGISPEKTCRYTKRCSTPHVIRNRQIK
jgi:hypothetical protein